MLNRINNKSRIGIMAKSLNSSILKDDLAAMWHSLKEVDNNLFIFSETGNEKWPTKIYDYSDLPILLSREIDILIVYSDTDGSLVQNIIRQLKCRIVMRFFSRTRFDCLRRSSRLFWSSLPLIGVISTTRALMEEFRPSVDENSFKIVRPLQSFTYLLTMPKYHNHINDQLNHSLFNILSIGEFEPSQRYEVLLRSLSYAVDRGYDIKLHVVGPIRKRFTKYYDYINTLINQMNLNDNVTIYGEVSEEASVALMIGCDLYCSASISAIDPTVFIKAMMFEMPIFGQSNPYILDICEQASFLLKDELSFKKSLIDFLENTILIDDLSLKSRIRYQEEFNNHRLTKSFKALVDHLLENSKYTSNIDNIDFGGYWFGIPHHDELIKLSLNNYGPFNSDIFLGYDRRLDFIDWIFREGVLFSDEIKAILYSPVFSSYIESIEVPNGEMLCPDMKTLWFFNRHTNSRFSLNNHTSVSAYINWYHKTGSRLYAFKQAKSC